MPPVWSSLVRVLRRGRTLMTCGMSLVSTWWDERFANGVCDVLPWTSFFLARSGNPIAVWECGDMGVFWRGWSTLVRLGVKTVFGRVFTAWGSMGKLSSPHSYRNVLREGIYNALDRPWASCRSPGSTRMSEAAEFSLEEVIACVANKLSGRARSLLSHTEGLRGGRGHKQERVATKRAIRKVHRIVVLAPTSGRPRGLGVIRVHGEAVVKMEI
ncbi:hypothetical protein Tco_0005199 [Tanacetum coccineum]